MRNLHLKCKLLAKENNSHLKISSHASLSVHSLKQPFQAPLRNLTAPLHRKIHAYMIWGPEFGGVRCAVCGARCAVCGEEILAVRKLHRMPRRVRASRPTRAFICSRPGFRGFLGVHMSPRWWLKRSATGAMTFPLIRPVSGDAQFLRKGVSHSRNFQQFRAKLHSFLST